MFTGQITKRVLVGVAGSILTLFVAYSANYARDMVSNMGKLTTRLDAHDVTLSAHQNSIQENRVSIAGRVTIREYEKAEAKQREDQSLLDTKHREWAEQVIKRLEERNAAADARDERQEAKIDRLDAKIDRLLERKP